MDDTQRTIDGKANFAEKQLQLLVLNIPGLREQYGEAKLDKQGNPIPANNRIRNAFSPVKITDEDARFAEFLNNYDRYAKINRDENRTTYLETEKVNEIYRSIIDADPEEKKKILRNLANENPELLDKVVKKVETDMSGMSPEEILIKNMGVTARAQYVTDRIKSEENKEKKRLLLKHYIETGIATDAVIEYVGSK